MYEFLNSNNLISQNQSEFRPGDSTTNQLLSITTDIYEAFEHYEETRAVFLDISKAFDKLWHEGLIFKLKQNGIRGPLINLIYSFLSDRKQRVHFKWLRIKLGRYMFWCSPRFSSWTPSFSSYL